MLFIHSVVKVLNNATLAKPGDFGFPSLMKKPSLGPSFPFFNDVTIWVEQLGALENSGKNRWHRLEVLASRHSVRTISTITPITQGVVRRRELPVRFRSPTDVSFLVRVAVGQQYPFI